MGEIQPIHARVFVVVFLLLISLMPALRIKLEQGGFLRKRGVRSR